jgi:hypothetical protein
MSTKLKFLVTGILFFFLSVNCFAGKRFWVAAAAGNWNNTANWSTTSGGGGGSSVPGSSDTAFFDSGGNFKCTINASVNVKRFEMKSSFTDTVSQGANSITIGTGNCSLSGGKFIGGSASISVSGTFTISGTAFKSTSGTLSISGNYTLSGSGSFTNNNGIVKFTATNTITGSTTFYKLDFAPSSSSTYTIAGGTTLTVNNTLSTNGSSTLTINTGNISAAGNIVLSNTSNSGGGSATLTINGSGTQTFTGGSLGATGRLPNIVINKSSSDTLKLINVIPVAGNWTWTAGIINGGTSTVHFIGSKTISGTHTLANIRLGANSTFTISSTLTVDSIDFGNSTGAILISTGTINANGNINLDNPSTGGGGSGSIIINGTGNQTVKGNTTSGTSALPNVTINKSSGTLSLTNIISAGGNWTWTAGTISPGSSTVDFVGTKTISGSHTLGNVTFDGGSGSGYKIATTSTLTITGTLTINGTAAVTLDSGTVAAQGNIITSNSSSSSGGNATIEINGTGNQTLTGSGTAGQGKFPKITIDKTTGVLTLASVISVYGDWIYTKGSVAEGTSSVALYGTSNLDGQISGGSAMMRFYSLAISGDTRTLTGNIDVNKNFTIASGATLSAGSNSIYLAGNWNSQGTWTYGTSTVVFDSTGYKQISGTSGTQINFYNITFNKQYSVSSPSSINLVRPLKINHTATFTEGHIKATSTNYLEFADNATLVGGSDSAYVCGPVRKTGDDAFSFPLGDTTLIDTAWHPLAMTAPSSTGDQFEATYFPVAQSYGSTLSTGDTAVSACEYWTFKRSAGSSTPTVSLTWNSNCDNSGFTEMTELLWNGSAWLDLGQASVTVNNAKSGTLVASSATSFTVNPAPVTIGYKTVKKSFSVLAKTPDGGYFNTDGSELYFAFNEEYKDGDGLLSYSIRDLSTGQDVTLLANANNSPAVSYGNNHYRIDLYNTSNVPLSSGYYMLEVINEKNEKWYLRFKI